MEITGSALTALFVGLVWTLIKVVEYFISKRKEEKNIDKNKEDILELYNILLAENKKSFSEINKELDKVFSYVKRLDELHSVYDENHVPIWYIPSEILNLVRRIDKNVEQLCKEMEDSLDDVQDSQTGIVEKVIDLITSQRIMVERLGDLISKLNTIYINKE